MEVPFDIADFDSIADFKVLAKSETGLTNDEVLTCLSKCTRTQKTGEVTFYDTESDDFYPSCDPKTEEPFDPPMTYDDVTKSLATADKSKPFTIFTHEGKHAAVVSVLVARDSDVLDDQHVVFLVRAT